MKRVLFAILFHCPLLYAQPYPVGNPSQWMTNEARVKIMLVSAEWCGYCKETRNLFERSNALHPSDSSQIAYFEFPEKWSEAFSFQGETYTFFASGPNQGRHDFVENLMAQADARSFPLFLIWDSQKENYSLYSGMLSESDWTSVLGAILNQRASPDSVSSN